MGRKRSATVPGFADRLSDTMDDTGWPNSVWMDKIGVSKNYVAGYKDGSIVPSVPTLYKICEVAGISADWLLGLEK